ncbi:serine threonine kinase [Fusarium tjaetaba]|uniref:Serine threonine kinase n=1 Tax=Fusarium tjaetaba TaxID=1567544 RepID=A0A8H5S6H4_9HYPO|nr:serine threonine kinase [Fusarium tjaetaba]KAF5646108.1 serine threonine kinase [Fusarium tjaetaba]
MALSFRTSPTSDLPSHEQPIDQATISSTALDFVYALSTVDFELYTSAQLHFDGTTVRVAGRGGYATVEIGTIRSSKNLVAVKRSLMQWENHQPTHPQDSKRILGKDFEQVVQELRILGHKKVRSHDNIVSLEGFCLDEINGVPSLALIIEYSHLGTLREFLVQNNSALSPDELFNLALQGARGLDALHKLLVCHGDVKIDNALVFESSTKNNGKNGWVVKISDFGQSIIACRDDPAGRVPCRSGTRLREAPEIRRGQALEDPGYDIQAALKTDVFSFGLFVWEVMKNGQGYFDSTWTGLNGRQYNVDMMEDFLDNLPGDALLTYGTEFANSLNQHPLSQRLLRVFEGSLRDKPQTRSTMSELVEAFGLSSDKCEEKKVTPDSPTDFGAIFGKLGFDVDDESSIGTWGTSKSFYDLVDQADLSGYYTMISQVPMLLQRKILVELKGMAISDSTETHSSGHSAMTVAECYTLGFGGSHDITQVVQWLGTAASKGFKKAGLVYHRVCEAVDIQPQDLSGADEGKALEMSLKGIPTEDYLSERILHHSRTVLENARHKILGHDARSLLSMADGIFLSTFSEAKTDTLLPLHAASWLGEEALVSELLKSTPPDAQSALGFNAAHFACLGGHLSVLKLLSKHNVPLSTASLQLITPLHLAIFFQPSDLASAVNLLLEHGCSLEVRTHTVKWDAHDLSIYGTPIQWALQTRNRTLVRILLPLQAQSPYPEWLDNAIQDFYWELLEDLLPYFQGPMDDVVTLQPATRPFTRYIAHGRDYGQAIERTVRLCHDNGILGFTSDGLSQLDLTMTSSRTLTDFLMLNCALDVCSADYIRYRGPEPFSAPLIVSAFGRTNHQEALRDTLSRLTKYYTLDELEDGRLADDYNLLGVAVARNNVTAARILLERGVDVNKPYAIGGVSIMNPIQTCLFGRPLPEMLSLLVEYGADLLAKCSMTSLTPLQLLLIGPVQVGDILNILASHSQPDQVYVETLYRSFARFCYMTVRYGLRTSPSSQELKKPQLRTHYLEQFRRLLMDPRFVCFIDEPFHPDGSTMIQQAASIVHHPAVRLLLDAGADASRPFIRGNNSILPLQLAVLKGRLLQEAKIESPDPLPGTEYISMDLVMEVATELLQWHLARSDGLFDGISELHIAYSMMYAEGIKKYLEAAFNFIHLWKKKGLGRSTEIY